MSCASECVGRCIGGDIHIQNKEFADQLIIEADENPITVCSLPSTRPKICSNLSKPCTSPSPHPAENGCRQCSHISTVPEDDPDFSPDRSWLNSRTVGTLQIESNPDSRSMKVAYDAILNTEDLYKQDFQYLSTDQMILSRRRQELLHKRWSENVYDPIRCAVEKETSGRRWVELQLRKKQLYKEYLEHANRKGHVFLDVYDSAEYFPFSLAPSKQTARKARTGPLDDPLLFQERERNREAAVAFHLATGSALRPKDAEKIHLPILPLVPLGRHGVNWKKWNEMQLGQVDSQVRLLSRRKMRFNRNHSNVTLGDDEDDDNDDEGFIYVAIKKQPSNTRRETSNIRRATIH